MPASRSHGKFLIEKLSGNELHYDLRLDSKGVLTSWAVAGGPSTSPGERRTALRLEDTPVDEYDFQDDFATEDLSLWDSGTYRTIERPHGPDIPLTKALERGRLWLEFQGEKIKGLYELVRVNPGEEEEDEEWLLIRALEEALQPH